VFLTKKFKGKISIAFLKRFLNAKIRNIKIQSILDIIEISKYMELNKLIQKNLWKCSLKCFLWFFKIWWVYENQGVMFLVVPPKDMITHLRMLLATT
jgi:hypothetical protein